MVFPCGTGVKKDGGIHFCLDYCTLNQVASFCQNLLAQGVDSMYYTVWVIWITFGAIWPSGEPAIFQRSMDALLRGLLPRRLVATYLDDVVIYSNSVLTIYNASSECSIFLHSASLTAKPKQNFLAIKATMFLSPIIGGGAFVQTRSSWRQCWHGLCPQQSAQYAPFFKLCGYYRQFSPNFATLVDECHCKCSTQSGGMVRWLWGVFCVLK